MSTFLTTAVDQGSTYGAVGLLTRSWAGVDPVAVADTERDHTDLYH
jgi:hypothetical protein